MFDIPVFEYAHWRIIVTYIFILITKCLSNNKNNNKYTYCLLTKIIYLLFYLSLLFFSLEVNLELDISCYK